MYMNNRVQRVPVFGRGLASRYYGDGLGNVLRATLKGAQKLFRQAAPKLKKAGIQFLKSTGKRLKEAGEKYIEDNKDEIKDELKKLGKRATKIAQQEAEEAVKEVLEGQNVKETIKTRGQRALSRTARSARSRGKRVSKAQATKIQDIVDQQLKISTEAAKEAIEGTKTELGKDLEKVGKKIRKDIDQDIKGLKLDSLFGNGLTQLGKKRGGKGLRQLGRGANKK